MTPAAAAKPTKRRDIFFPVLSVYDGGRIEIDFVDSYDHSVDAEGCDAWFNDAPGATLLDTLVPTSANGLSLPASLRLLAEHIEKQEASS